MAKVHTFALDNDLYTDTRIPYQYRGGGRPNTRRAFELSALLAFIEANIGLEAALEGLPVYDNDDDAIAALGNGKPYRSSAIHDRLSNALLFTPE